MYFYLKTFQKYIKNLTKTFLNFLEKHGFGSHFQRQPTAMKKTRHVEKNVLRGQMITLMALGMKVKESKSLRTKL